MAGDNKGFHVTGNEYIKVIGQVSELERQLRLGLTENGKRSLLNPKIITSVLGNLLKGGYNFNKHNSILKLISPLEGLMLDPTNGTRTIASATNTFQDISINFKQWGIDFPKRPTEASLVQVYEIYNSADTVNIFNSFLIDLDLLCLSQPQIVNFCEKYKDWLGDNLLVFFLTKENNEYIIVQLRSLFGHSIDPLHFGRDLVKWAADSKTRVITPLIL